MSPANLPWWAWLLASFVTLIVATLFFRIVSYLTKDEDSALGCTGEIVIGLVALLFAIIGIIRFIKWAWVG
jgi:membrane protein YdbS with pleckstrin-like domain